MYSYDAEALAAILAVWDGLFVLRRDGMLFCSGLSQNPNTGRSSPTTAGYGESKFEAPGRGRWDRGKDDLLV